MTNAIVYYRPLAGLSHALLAARWLQLLPDAKRIAVARASEPSAIATLAGIDLLAHGLKALGGASFDARSLAYSEKGRPELLEGPAFSISHSPALVVCAVVQSGRVGVDVELAARVRAESLRRVASAAELAFTRRSADGAAKLWTRKEAVLKAAGATVFEAAAVAVRDSEAEFRGERWYFRGPESLEAHALALAFERADVEVELRRATDLA